MPRKAGVAASGGRAAVAVPPTAFQTAHFQMWWAPLLPSRPSAAGEQRPKRAGETVLPLPPRGAAEQA